MKTYDEMTEEVIGKVKDKRAKRRGLVKKLSSAALALVLVTGAVLAAGYSGRMMKTVVNDPEKAPDGGTDAASGNGGVLFAKADYGEIFDLLSVTDRGGRGDLSYDADLRVIEKDANVSGEKAAPNEAEPSPDFTTAPSDAAEEDTSEYSGTNVQVEGIDEADVIKTDGRYIYAVSHSNVYIISVDNGQMENVSKIAFRNEDGTAVGFDGEDLLVPWGTPDIYITGDRLVIVTGVHEAQRDEQGNLCGIYWYYGDQAYSATVYDITDRAAPSLIDTVYISGSGVSSRLNDGKLYLIANDRYYGQIDREDPATFIPTTYANGDKELVPVDSIYCGEEKSDCCYLNIMEVDVSNASVTSEISLLGCDGDIMYQNADNIFVAKTDYTYDYSEETVDGVTKEVSKNRSDTVLAKISVEGGLALVGSARIDGYLHNSFSMDEYEGYLRVVTSIRNSEYVSEWRKVERETETETAPSVTDIVYGDYDGDVDFSYRYQYDDYYDIEYITDDWSEDMYNNLYILDSSMNVTGKLERLAPDERIYSCRFEGKDGYFVTYRETDPLFHVDLSDPASPRVIDELKIPGHSDYLQRFGDYLFGFGADDEGYLKLSMFSEDESGAMKEIAVISIPGAGYSEALYDHHAILADADKGIICFSAETWYEDYEDAGMKWGTNYYIVRWNGQAFEIAMTASVGEWADAIRGLYIGDAFYVYVSGNYSDNAITSYSLDTFEKIDSVEMDEPVAVDYGWDDYGVIEDELEPIAIYD